MAITGSVNAVQTIYFTDGAGIGGAINLVTSSSGAVTETINNVDGWSIAVGNGTASPPISGSPAQSPTLNLTITANYAGGAGSTLDIYFGSDGFGPSSTLFTSAMTGHLVSGTGMDIAFSTWDVSGSAVPSVANPIPMGANTLSSFSTTASGGYNSSATGGPVNLSSYSLGEHVTLTGAPTGSGYNIDGSLTPVPEPSTTALATLAAIGALALGMMQRRRY